MVHDPALVASLRDDLAAAFTLDLVADLLGGMAASALGREQNLPADRATRGRTDPTATLVRLFTLGLPVARPAVDHALPRTGAAGLGELGLARHRQVGDEVVAEVDVRPYGDDAGRQWWLVSDFGEPVRQAPLATDHVLGAGGASLTLASWTPRRPVGTALDVGTGCCVQTLHLATHARTLVATDLSVRALQMAALTAALAGVEVDLRHGDLLDPVAGQRFDLVVSNPPFVITPRRRGLPRYEYRDGGLAGDAVVERLIRSVGDHLEPGGVAQLLGNWEIPAGGRWTDRVGEWVAGSGLDAWVVQREEQDIAEYAETWARDGGAHPGTDDHDRLYNAWLDDFEQRGIERVGFGVVTLRRPGTAAPSRRPWTHLEELRGPVAPALGETVATTLDAWTALADTRAEGRLEQALLDTAWVVAADVTEERHFRPGADDPAAILLRQGSGLRRTRVIDTATAALVGVCDGSLPAGAAIDAIAVLLDRAPGDVRREVLPTLEALVVEGFVGAGAPQGTPRARD
ncbi:MAG TPA: methyltransferase [Dermatophilaceae bacterium]|nr:methyltransferase [Dermatophilaceae bacterium]